MNESVFIKTLNTLLSQAQSRLCRLEEKSFILQNLDNVILFFISLTLLISLFATSDYIVLPAIAVIFLTFLKLIFGKKQNFQIQVYGAMLLLYLGFCIISTLYSTETMLSLKGLSKNLIYLGYYFSVFQYLRYNKDKMLYFIILIASLCSIESVCALAQSQVGALAGATWQDVSHINPEDVINRVYGTLQPYNPNLLGAYILTGFSSLLTLAALALSKKHFKSFIIASILSILSLLALFYTGCRGAYLGLFALIFGLFVLTGLFVYKEFEANKKIKTIYISIISSITVLCGIFMLATPAILKRIISIFMLRGDSSTSFRMNVYQSSWQMFLDNWIFGIGIGNQAFREVYGFYMKTGFDALSAYNIFLEVAVETGVFGLICFSAFIVFLLKDSFKLVMQTSEVKLKIILAGAFLAILAVVVHGLFDTIFYRPQIQFLFWILVSILTVNLNESRLDS